MGYTLDEIAAKVGGQVIGDRAEVDRAGLIHGANPIQDAQNSEITLLDAIKNRDQLKGSAASAVVVPEPIDGIAIPQVVVPNVHRAFQEILKLFRPQRTAPHAGVHRASHIDPSAQLGRDVSVGEGASIGRDCVIGQGTRIHRGVHIMDGCRIGNDCEIFPGVVLYQDSILEDRVTLHAGVVLGAYGFGYRTEKGRHERTAQMGHVHIESDVEIGANTTIDRGTYGATRIGEGTKIDNQVMVGHNCKIGKHNLICAHVGIAGSCTTGDYVVLAGQVGLKDHIRLGDKVIVAAQSGIASDVESNSIIMGAPAQPIKREMQCISARNRLPEMRDTLRALEAKIAELEQALNATREPAAQESIAHTTSHEVEPRKVA